MAPTAGDFFPNCLTGTRESFQIEWPSPAVESKSLRWTLWALEGVNAGTDGAVVFVEDLSAPALARQRLQQAERLETISQLASVHEERHRSRAGGP